MWKPPFSQKYNPSKKNITSAKGEKKSKSKCRSIYNSLFSILWIDVCLITSYPSFKKKKKASLLGDSAAPHSKWLGAALLRWMGKLPPCAFWWPGDQPLALILDRAQCTSTDALQPSPCSPSRHLELSTCLRLQIALTRTASDSAQARA